MIEGELERHKKNKEDIAANPKKAEQIIKKYEPIRAKQETLLSGILSIHPFIYPYNLPFLSMLSGISLII